MEKNTKTNKLKFNHISKEERFTIQKLYESGSSLRSIELVLGRSPNTISYEIKNNKVKNTYNSEKAQRKAYYTRWRSKRTCLKVSMDSYLDTFVREKLIKHWSPRQISGFLKKEKRIIVSQKAIYRYVYSRSLERHLFWGWNKHKTGTRKATVAQNKDGRKYIEERPVLNGIGHYELDFIVSSCSPIVLMVLVDRFTKYTRVLKLDNRKRTTIHCAFSELFSGIPVKSITTDNDIAFQHWKELESSIQSKIYFCHPYHPWEKGLVENTNRWIRCFAKKKKDIALVTKQDLKDIHDYVNERPREIIDFRLASEYYQQMTVLIEG